MPSWSSPWGRAYPPYASTTVENCFPSRGLLLAGMIQVSLLVVTGLMQPKPGSECGIRLDQSQEPLASSV